MNLLLNLFNSPQGKVPFFKGGNWPTDDLSDLPKVMEVASNRARTQNQAD
jgi:hypothetical protein